MLLPATKGNQLIKDINAVLANAPHYIAQDDFWFRRMLAEAEKLKSVNRPEAYNILAQLYGLAGDARAAEQYIDTAIKLRHDPAVIINKAVILSNLGFFTAAQEPFKLGASPREGQFTSNWKLGLCVGYFHTLSDFVVEAKRMNLDLSTIDTSLISRGARLMDEIGVTDEQLGRALDVAGSILREERLFFVGHGPDISVWDDDALERHLSLIFKLPVEAAKAIALDEELGHRLFEKCGDLPSELMIHFESGVPLH